MSSLRVGPYAVRRTPPRVFVEGDSENEWLEATEQQKVAYKESAAVENPAGHSWQERGFTYSMMRLRKNGKVEMTNTTSGKVRQVILCSEEDLPEHGPLGMATAADLSYKMRKFMESSAYQTTVERCKTKPEWMDNPSYEADVERLLPILSEYEETMEVLKGAKYIPTYMPADVERWESEIRKFAANYYSD